MNQELNKSITEYWSKHYVEGCLCSLCGNTGIIDTRSSAVSPSGIRSGRLNWCICPNGQTYRNGGWHMDEVFERYIKQEIK